jgi:accessory gene regulator B
MRINPGIIERLSISGARYMKQNGADPSISEGILRFSLQLWISTVFIFALTAATGLLLDKFPESILALTVLGALRYFSGGWHFRNMDACVVFTVTAATAIPFVPRLSDDWLIVLNCISLLLVWRLAPTGHGQKFSTDKQKRVFKWISVTIVTISFAALHQVAVISMLFQSLTLITWKGGMMKWLRKNL